MYTVVEEAGVYHHNLRTHQRLFEVLLEAVRARRLAVKRTEVALGRQYQELYEQWRTHLTGDFSPRECTVTLSCRSLAPIMLQHLAGEPSSCFDI